MAAARALGRSPLLHALRDGPSSAAANRGPSALRASLLALRALDDDDDDVRAAAAACYIAARRAGALRPPRGGGAAARLARGGRRLCRRRRDGRRARGSPARRSRAPPVVEEAEADEAEGRALFAKEADNFHEEPLQQAQLAAALLRPLLLKRVGSWRSGRRAVSAWRKELSAALKAERRRRRNALRRAGGRGVL